MRFSKRRREASGAMNLDLEIIIEDEHNHRKDNNDKLNLMVDVAISANKKIEIMCFHVFLLKIKAHHLFLSNEILHMQIVQIKNYSIVIKKINLFLEC